VLSSGELLFDAVEPILALRRDDIAATLRHYGVDGSPTELRTLAAGLPPSVGIKRLVTWLRVAATRARLNGVLTPISADIFHEEHTQIRETKIPLKVVEEVLVEFGILMSPTQDADSKDGAQNSLHW
jgi:hypothetical protein